MEYFLELKFEDSNYNALIHFATTFIANSEIESELFVNELLSAFKRRNIMILSNSYNRIDNNPELRERIYEYHDFYLKRATAQIKVEQFHVDNPNQEKSLWDNLVGKFFEGEDSTANIGNKYNIPVRVVDKKTRNQIDNEFYYFSVEHLIPKN